MVRRGLIELTQDTHDFEPWVEKNRSQVTWRGTITGVFHRERYDWRSSQRDRLAKLTGDRKDEEVVLLIEENGVLSEQSYPRGELVERWMDVGVIDHVSISFRSGKLSADI
jgi:beta-1,2-xylosyltransferase